jgi:TonB-dependent receptor
MNYSFSLRSPVFIRLLSLATSLAVIFTVAGMSSARAADAGTGSISGTVTSTSTHNALQGATVSIPTLHRTEFTDSSGSFLLQNVPAGAVELIISYVGFGDERITVAVRSGETSRIETAMKASESVLTMEAFTVATQREGQALSITEQRNAPNIKNVVAFDGWGILPTQNVGELATRLPGITFTTDEDQLINNVSIGGMPPNYTRLNIDGMSSTGVGGDGRTATLHSFSAAGYEQIEIINGQTPDKRADSLGGQLNLKTRSPLAMSERHRGSYSVSSRWFPPWSDRNFAVSERPWRPDLGINYTQVFDVGEGHRNLGVVLSANYQEVLNPHDWYLAQYQNTTEPVAWLQDFDRRSGLNDRFITGLSARADYQVSKSTRVSFRYQYNAGSEPFFHYTFVNPFISSAANLSVYNATTNPNGAIMPGYTAHRTEIRPVGNAQMLFNIQRYSFTSKNPTGTLVFEHNWGRLKVDHAYRWSNTHWDSGAGREREDGVLNMRTKDPIGFILDDTDPLHGHTFTQTAGPSVYDAASYTPFVTTAASSTVQVPVTSVSFTKRDTITDTNEVSGTINASYNFDTSVPFTVRAGLDTVNRRVNNRQVYPQRWYQVPGTVLSGGLMPLTEFEGQNGGPRMPIFDPASISTQLNNSALWTPDPSYTATQQFTNRRIMEEGVDAAYVRFDTKVSRLYVTTGLRGEWVTTDTFTFFRYRTTPVAAEPDPFKRAAGDYVPFARDGSYHKWFPSLHLAYDITPNFKARASWSTSYGRPFLADLIASPTADDRAQTVTIGNPALKPQMAKNIDGKLEYYWGSTGMASLRGFYKKVTDYIGPTGRSGLLVPNGEDNGFDGLYAGYEIIQRSNLGKAYFKGLEFDFRQRLTFLPGAFKGLTARGNYTYVESRGRFAGSQDLKFGQVQGYIPRAYNVGLNYTYGKFGASYDVNWTGKYPVTYSLTSANSNVYRQGWTRMNAGVTYRILRDTTLFLNLNNITEEGARQYTYYPDRARSEWITPRSVKFGVSGQF